MHAEDMQGDARMSAYLDGALDPDESAAFEASLETDPDGQAELDGMRRLLGALGSLPEPEVPEDFYEQLRRRMRHMPTRVDDRLQHMVALPFQVLSVVIILAAAAIFLMAELDREREEIDREAPKVESSDAPEAGDPKLGRDPV